MVPLAIDQVLHSVLCWVNSTVAGGSCVKLNEMGIWKMNERIKELMAQAGFDPAAIQRMGIMPQAEKFAELIVKECFDTIKSNQWAKDNQAFSKGMNYSAELIKEHFGVEE